MRFPILLDYLFPIVSILCAVGLVHTSAPKTEVIPRIAFRYNEGERAVRRFQADKVKNYTSLLLSQDGATLYVGARGALFALPVLDIADTHRKSLIWNTTEEKRNSCSFKGKNLQTDCYNYIKILLQLNSTHLFTCGTYAFSPNCTYIDVSNFTVVKNSLGQPITEDGRGRCPFDPEYRSTAILVDGELYTGTVTSFQGNDPSIFRAPLKTESSLNWLQDPVFVGSAYIQESLPKGNPVGDDDKIYYFFSETGKEFEFFENTIVSRIARVCKGDMGGERVLQKRWTTFLKAQLLCSRPDDGFPFNVIQDMFVLTPTQEAWKSTIFYGVFTSQWHKSGSSSSAVCAFTMDQVEASFQGRYKEVNRETQQWHTYNSPVPEPRPGACITNTARKMNINSSLQMPDRVLNFLKDHFLMHTATKSQPLLLNNVGYRRIVVQRVQGVTRQYNVLFLGTDDGKLHKAINVNGKVHIIEEIQVFPESQPIQNILLDPEKGFLYVSSYSGVAQVPVANCSIYQSCGECVLSRDPYCAWMKERGCRVPHPSDEIDWIQDVETADTEKLCQEEAVLLPVPRTIQSPYCEVITLPLNTMEEFPCKLRSNLARRQWFHNGQLTNESYVILPDGRLMLFTTPERLGRYECWSEEEGFRQLIASYCVVASGSLKPTTTVRPLTSQVDARELFFNVTNGNTIKSAQMGGKTYWNEFLGVLILLAVVVIVLGLFLLYKKFENMKEGDCSNMQQKKQRKGGKPAETLPLNGSALQNSTSDHRGYQTLNDNYISTTPVHEVPINGKGFTESEKRPLDLKQTHVEIDPLGPRPRVRLGSEIRDSVV
ncbi:semaphorin-4B isoform X2 [Latimeria chalumnae]|uniref:Semaphorin 4B n=1 Tax=Latimeria chalumnae TaxID=7897 RepID=M3XGT0_LATCH|nr:PREDICTED: semaphorin-4B isoform X2 [Latimeria chalumnae]|eukprot:XP_005989836.1 PREDICTED: semaphorin-4B isoform X2 [Latimeria chalumnae]